MLVEIRKAGFINKGAQLMLFAIMQKLKQQYPTAKLAMETGYGAAPYIDRAKLGFYQKSQLYFKGMQFGLLAYFVPKRVRETYGVVMDNELDLVLDAAGFAYGDQWGFEKTKELALASARWKKNGTKVVLLPQAFGPFKNKQIRKYIKQIITNCDLIYARDKVSYKYLHELAPKQHKIRMAPDFTNLIAGRVPHDFDSTKNRVAVIPNVKMIEKRDNYSGNHYLLFLKNVCQHLLDKGAKPFFLIHEGSEDLKLVEQINSSLSQPLSIINEENPIIIKGIISTCDAVISSRFHGLVSALSEGVPALGSGWAHKYQMLFDDYDFSEGMLDTAMNLEQLQLTLDRILAPNTNLELRKHLTNKSQSLKTQTAEMWKDVFDLIENAAEFVKH